MIFDSSWLLSKFTFLKSKFNKVNSWKIVWSMPCFDVKISQFM
jgi:hypothetical protein